MKTVVLDGSFEMIKAQPFSIADGLSLMWREEEKLSFWLFIRRSVIWCPLTNRRSYLNLSVCWQETRLLLLLSLLR